jgi:L-ascorbate metabolism protein UlaG (beta-lactamase superfamily)
MAEVARSHRDLLREIDATELVHGKAAFWWLGQLGFVVKLGHTVAYLDPYLAENPARRTPPLLRPEEITNASICTGSHDHGDHIDPQAIPGLAQASPECKFVVPNPHVERMLELGCAPEHVIGLRPDETAVAAGVKITAVKARHEFFDETELGFPHLGYVVEANGVCFYHSGDTLAYDGLRAALGRWGLDAVFLPINGRDAVRYRAGCIGNMTYQEAVDLAGDVRPALVVPAHYDMFADNAADPHAFADYLGTKFPDVPCWIGPAGEKVVFGGPWSDRDEPA